MTASVNVTKAKPVRAARDITEVLKLMRDGVLVTLQIRKPSFQTSIYLDDLALETGGLDEEARAVKTQFRLGYKRLLPNKVCRQLERAESQARQILYRFSVDYHDPRHSSRFLIGPNFSEWEAANQVAEAHFWQVAGDIIGRYEELVEQVLTEYHKIALFRWRQEKQRRLAALAAYKQPDEGDYAALDEEQPEFVERYMEQVRAAIPPVERVRASFGYKTWVESLTLPLEAAENLAQAEAVHNEARKERAELEAKLRVIQLQTQQLEAETWAKQLIEEERARTLYQAELAAASRQLEIERSRTELELARLHREEEFKLKHIEMVAERRSELVENFWHSVVAEINITVNEACGDLIASLDKNGRLVSRSSVQLKNLMDKLAGFRDYLQDEGLAGRIEELAQALPQAVGPKQTINLVPLKRVLEGMQREAQTVLAELNTTAPRITDERLVVSSSVTVSAQERLENY